MKRTPGMPLTALVMKLAVLALVAGACMSTPAAHQSARPSASPVTPGTAPAEAPASAGVPASAEVPAMPEELTPWQNETANLEPDGTRSLESALTLFAMAFGPIPGVEATTAAIGTVGSASPAIRAVSAYRDQLADAQRAAIDAYLAPSGDDVTLDIPSLISLTTASRGGAMPLTEVSVDNQPEDPFERDMVQLGVQARRAASPYFGEIPNTPAGKPGLAIRITHAPSEPFVTFFNATFGPGGFEKCDVIVNSAHAGDNMGLTGRSLTLDVVHCYQTWRMGTDQGFDGNVPAWAWEGPAEYVMLEAWPVQEDDVLYWATYLRLPDVSLFERSYDAIGFYAQAREAGLDLGDVFVAVLTDVDNPERFALAGATSGAFLDKWASELVRSARGEWGAAWDFSGPGPSLRALGATPEQPMSVSTGSLEAFSQDAYSNHLFVVNSDADIVFVDGNGRVRIGDGSVDAIGGGAFCTTDKGCGPCPDGSEPSVNPTPLSSVSVLAVSGGTDGTNGSVHGHALEEFCEPPSEPPSDDPNKDEFCKRYRAWLAWSEQHAGTDYELSQPWAGEISQQFEGMRPYAPDHLIDDVDLYIRVYGLYASAPEPINVPIVGPEAAFIADAFMAMNVYCGITL